jgi:cytochrome c-type biogenesis protein CcmH
MMLFWAIAAALTAAALLFLLPPLLRRRTTAPDARVAANAAIYREQLDELAAELQRGALTQEEFERDSREIEHRIVSEYGKPAIPQPAGWRPNTAAALAVGLLLPVVVVLGYLQLGNPDAVGGAAAGAAQGPGHTVTPEQMESLVQRLADRLQQTPDDAEGWMLLGRSLNVLQRYDRAAEAYARAVKLAPGDAGLLADYADTLAMAHGRSLEGEPFALIKRALEIDPEHVKALALAGTAEFDRRNYAGAIAYWERILKIVPPESEFARSVEGSIAEARTLGGSALAQKDARPVEGKQATAGKQSAAVGKPATAEKQAAAGNQSLQGTVSIDPALAAGLSPGDTVFVLARPVSGSRMPLAIARTTVAALPYRFTLDDSMAMAAGATISSQAQVVVAARVSRSGTAVPQKGDIEGTSAPVAPGAKGVNVVLSRIVD